MPKQVRSRTEKTKGKAPMKASPASQNTGALPALAAALLLALAFLPVLQPSLRMVRLWSGQDGFERHKLDATVDGIPAEWGYAAWTGPVSDDIRNKFGYLGEKISNVTFTLPPKVNLNIDGRPLVIHGTTFQNGFGTHAPSKIAFDLQGKAGHFSCKVGQDSTSSPDWGVVYVVLADGREIFRSPKMKSDAEAFPIDVPVAGAKELVLCADNTEFTNTESNVDWVDLKFIP